MVGFRQNALPIGCLLFLLSTSAPVVAQSATFFVRNYSGKCLDFGPPPQIKGSPVFIYDCNGTVAQQIRVEEINERHEVILHAGTLVIGVPRLVSTGPATSLAPQSELPLELQNEANRLTGLSVSQVFALDGDSIIFVANPSRVVQVQNGRGASRTPVVLGQRDLTEREFWTFANTDGVPRKLTSGFVRVPEETDLGTAVGQAKWGTVIEIDPNASIQLNDGLNIPAGVTLRGDRHGLQAGPDIFMPLDSDPSYKQMLVMNGDQARITGLRLRGPSAARNLELPHRFGVSSQSAFNSLIDHNEILDWTDAAVWITGTDETKSCASNLPPSHPETVRVVRNFVHHNEKAKAGYGVLLGGGGYASIENNTFSYNRHAISDDGSALSGYRAWFNLVLTGTPTYKGSETHEGARGPQQDFDMHGTAADSGDKYVGGVAGDYMDIARNTFLASGSTARHNLELRGTPCYRADFHENVTRESLSRSIENDGDVSGLRATDDNRFGIASPTDHLGVGDFDGDGKDDLFLATGAAWYYAPAGTTEWRFLNDMRVDMGSLLFGDFDGDGRTDVFMQRGREWFVSWAGVSAWEKINETDASFGDLAIGDFDGDRRADVFYADGQKWWISRGAIGKFELLDDSTFRVKDLRFGDFNGDGKTDVFGIEGNQWKISYGGTSGWKPLPQMLTDSVANLFVADFNGDGRADIALLIGVMPHPTTFALKVSYAGASNWNTLATYSSHPQIAAIGRFQGNRVADMLLWHENYLDISPGGSGVPLRQSRQDMR